MTKVILIIEGEDTDIIPTLQRLLAWIIHEGCDAAREPSGMV